ncbi:MAG: glutamate racemase, partial [Polyangiales bacterium]
LEPLLRAGIDTLVLGCTHYPLLRAEIARQLEALSGTPIPVVDSAEATAEELAALLDSRGLRAQRPEGGTLRLLVTDTPKRFSEVAGRFLGRSLEGLLVEAIDL